MGVKHSKQSVDISSTPVKPGVPVEEVNGKTAEDKTEKVETITKLNGEVEKANGVNGDAPATNGDIKAEDKETAAGDAPTGEKEGEVSKENEGNDDEKNFSPVVGSAKKSWHSGISFRKAFSPFRRSGVQEHEQESSGTKTEGNDSQIGDSSVVNDTLESEKSTNEGNNVHGSTSFVQENDNNDKINEETNDSATDVEIKKMVAMT